MIDFNIPYQNGLELNYVRDAYERGLFSGNGHYTQLCEEKLKSQTDSKRCLLTSSCSHALDMSAILVNIQAGDEVIMSSFNFVSAANAFVSRGAKIKFVDIDPKTMNIDPEHIESAITQKTKAVLVMHYGGIACDIETIKAITVKHNIFLIEDAAHCIDSYYNKRHLGTFGDLGTISFHSTKNIHCGEGGALLINNKALIERAEIIREKGTNRKAFFEGKVDKYSWVDIGSSHVMSELSAAFLYSQLQDLNQIKSIRTQLFNKYIDGLSGFIPKQLMSSQVGDHNAHLFYIKLDRRNQFILTMRSKGIDVRFHYVPLHNSKMGEKVSEFVGSDSFTTEESTKLVRLPLYPSLENQEKIISETINFISNN